MLEEIGTPESRGKLANEKNWGRKRKINGIRSPRLQKRRFTCAGDGVRSGAIWGKRTGKGKTGFQFARSSKKWMDREKASLRQCRSLCGSGVLDARLFQQS